MSKKSNIWITPHPDGWAVRREGGQRSSVVTDTKKDADKIGHDMGRRDRVDVITQGKDGKIQSHDSFGNDPCPPKDKEH